MAFPCSTVWQASQCQKLSPARLDEITMNVQNWHTLQSGIAQGNKLYCLMRVEVIPGDREEMKNHLKRRCYGSHEAREVF